MTLVLRAERRAVVPLVADLAVHAGRVAVVADGESVDYRDLAGMVGAAAAQIGVDRKLVAVTVGNGLDPLVWYLAALHGGHVVLPLPASDGGRLASVAAGYDPDVVVGPAGARWRVDVRREQSAHELHPDLALLLSTSGSTGSPRLVRLSHENVQANAAAISHYLDLRPSDRAVTSLPMHYCYGLSVIHSHLLAGAGLVLTDASVVDPCFWRAFRAGGATSLAGVPHTFELLERVGFDAMDLPTLRYVTQAGGRLDPGQVQRYAALAERDGWELFVMYGQTEATARMAYLPPTLAGYAPTSIGRPVPGGSFEIVPVEGVDADAGELVYRGPNVMLGYAEEPADLALGATVDALRTGDLARLRADGLYEIVGRRARFVKLFGQRIDLDQVESTLADDGVDALCEGDDRGLRLAVADRHGAPAIALRVAERLGLPRSTVEVQLVEALPRLPNGKPDRASLRQPPTPPVPAPLPGDVRGLFTALLGVSDLRDDDTFVSAGGDSLAYVEMSVALEDRLGALPEGWHLLPIADLESRPRQSTRLGRIEMGVLLRAVAIVVVVANHSRLIHLAGTAHVLLAVAGYNFARFPLASGRLLRSTLRVAVPSALLIGLAAVTRDDFDLVHAVLLRGPFGAEGARWGYWFVEALVHLLLGATVLLSIPAVRRIQLRRPFGLALGVVAAGLAVRFDAVGLPEPEHAIFRAHELLWIFGAGWAAAIAASGWQRLAVSATVLAACPGFFADPSRNALLLGGLLALIWVRTVPLPRVLGPVVGGLAGASLYIYLVHWQVLPLVEGAPSAVVVLLALGCGVLVARVARHATPIVEAALDRRTVAVRT